MALKGLWGFDKYTSSTHHAMDGWLDTNGVAFSAMGIGATTRVGSTGNSYRWTYGSGGSQGAWTYPVSIAAGDTLYWGAYVTIWGNGGSTPFASDNYNANPVVSFTEGGTHHIEIIYGGDSLGDFGVYRNGTQLVRSTGHAAITGGMQLMLECKVKVADAGGEIDLRINGVSVATFSGDTRNGGTGIVDGMLVGLFMGTSFRNGGGIAIDDMYLVDSNGSAPLNTFLGDVYVRTFLPTGAGTTTQWTPSAGSNYQNVDDNPSDEDTTYNSESTVSDMDTYAMGNMTVGSSAIHGVRVSAMVRKEGAGPRTIRTVLRSGSTNYEGSSFTLFDSYKYANTLYSQDPDTSAAFTDAGIDALEAGIKVQS
jgi:hypothetical protein